MNEVGFFFLGCLTTLVIGGSGVYLGVYLAGKGIDIPREHAKKASPPKEASSSIITPPSPQKVRIMKDPQLSETVEAIKRAVS